MLKPDVREMYLKQILNLNEETHTDFVKLINLSRLLLDKENKELDKLIDEFLTDFDVEERKQTLEYILFLMDGMKASNKRFLVFKGRDERKKFTYEEMLFKINNLRNQILVIIRNKAKTIRITNPESAAI